MGELDIIVRNIGVTFDKNPVFVLSVPILPIAPTDILQSEKRGTWGKSVGNMELSFDLSVNEINPNLNRLFFLGEKPKIEFVWTKKGKKKLHKLFKRMRKQYERKDATRV